MLNTEQFQYKESRWQDLYSHLKQEGFDVYSPGTKVGECTEPYIVVKNDGVTKHPNFSTDVNLYAVMCYVPKEAYSTLEPFVRSVKESLKKIRPLFKEYGQETGSYYDDDVKAHMCSVEYQNHTKRL